MIWTNADKAMVRDIVREEVDAALASAGQRTATLEQYITQRFQFGDDWTVVAFKVGDMRDEQWIEVSRLINIFENMEQHAAYIYEQLRKEATMDEVVSRVVTDHSSREHRRNRASAMRKAVTMRDSAGQMARLLKGEDLDAAVDPDEEMTGGSRAR